MPSAELETVFQSDRKAACNESHLVLVAVGIAAVVQRQGHRWAVLVEPADVPRAREELEKFRRENPPQPTTREPLVPRYGGAWPAAIVYAATILLFALITGGARAGQWRVIAQMEAGAVMAGQWWRIVTALTLHVDAAHVISNVLFGALFGLLAGRALGGGVAWLVIVVAGALGNGVNAALQSPDHRSLGASTAVFAALAILVSHALRPRRTATETLLRRWSPLIAGVVLFALTGVGGERTDVLAHLTGFLAGLVFGWIGARLPHHWLARSSVQWAAGLAALGIVGVAWRFALAQA